QTGPIYLAILFPITFFQKVQFTARRAFVLLFTASLTQAGSNAPAFGRPATIMRYRRPIFNRPYFNSSSGDRADGGFASGSRTTHSHFHRSQPVFFRFCCGRQRCLLRGEGSSLARSAESERSRA